MAKVDVEAIAKTILSQAVKEGGNTWTAIQKALPLYAKGYAQTIAEIAAGRAANEITADDAKMYADSARLLLEMAVANTAQVTLNAVQVFLNGVIDTVKGAINKSLPIAIL
jgi:ATP-dependent helicase YprA (DUF1998 family)